MGLGIAGNEYFWVKDKVINEEAVLTGIRFEPVPIPIEFSDEV